MNAALETTATTDVFRPRRFGHANLFVSDYNKAADFYRDIVGFNEVYRQPTIDASFVSNGNTYHDFGLTGITSKYAKPGQKPGLFHLALELTNEVALVAGYHKAKAAGLNIRSTVDHDVAHSVYLYDPDGTILEIYADITRDWRHLRSGIVSSAKPKWIPGETTVPVAEDCYPQDIQYTRVDGAVFQGKRVTHVAMITDRFEQLFDYYSGPIGLTPIFGSAGDDFAVLGGTASRGDLALIRRRPGLEPGMHHVGIEVWDEAELNASLGRLEARGITVERDIDHPARRAVTIADPDGTRLQFYVNRDWRAGTLTGTPAADLLYLL